MSGRNHAFLDLAALPAVGPALLSEAPALLYAADGRRVLFANAAGAAFSGETSIAALLERRLSAALPATDAIARFARSVPIGAARLERIRFSRGGGLVNIAAHCTHLALPGGDTAVLVSLTALAGAPPVAERARRLAEALAAEDCLVAIADAEGQPLTIIGEFEQMAAGEAAVEQLVGAMRKSGDRLVKRVVRVDAMRRPAGMVRFESEGIAYYLMVLGPGERIEIEPVAPVEVERQSFPDVPAETADAVALAVPKDAKPAEASPIESVQRPLLTGEEAAVGALSSSEPAIAQPPLDESAAVPEWTEPVAAIREDEVADEPADGQEPLDKSSEPEPSIAAELPAQSDPAFRFVQPGGPIRFVFQMDAETRFTFVSPDLAAVVGPQASDMVGVKWVDVASARGLDGAALAAVLARRDTWSGVTLEWPVDGSDARVAVDLAALPAFSRERRFEGYRGFGVIRPLEQRREKPVIAEGGEQPASNVVRLPRAATTSGETERLSLPEQDAFRRIAAALGVEEANRRSEKPAPTAGDIDDAKEAEPTEPAVAAEPERAEAQSVVSEASPPDRSEPDVPASATAAAVSAVPEPAIDETPAEGAALDVADDGLDLLGDAQQRILELEAMLDTATDGILVVDEEGLIERLNRSAEALFGIEAASVAGRPFTELLAEESRKSALDYLDGLARNGVASVLNDGREVIGRVPQGGLIPLFMTMGRLPATAKFCAVLRDITQWKNAEEELINAKRAAESASMQKSDFLAKVSHEIRTPLNAIIGFSEVMMEERFGPIGTERYKEYLRDINVSGAHLMSLLNDLLDLSKIEAGKLDLSFQAVALNEIVMECVAVMQPQANRERIIIRTSLSSEVPNIVADVRSIRQIVLNLVSNAIKFTLAGGQVIVSTVMEPHGEVTLRIRDTGVGMSVSDIETALKPFRQLSTSRARRSDGTGLGLPLTKALVEANRAAFAIDSTVGQGTLVRVTFPATRVLAE